jgi:hypothetical protein
VNDKFDVITALVYMEALKGTANGEDLYEKMSTPLEKHKLWWEELV